MLVIKVVGVQFQFAMPMIILDDEVLIQKIIYLLIIFFFCWSCDLGDISYKKLYSNQSIDYS